MLRLPQMLLLALGTVYNWPTAYAWPPAPVASTKVNPCVIYFTASWCGNCPAVTREVDSIKQTGRYQVKDWGAERASVFVVDIDKHPDIWQKFKVKEGIPQIVRYDGNLKRVTHFKEGYADQALILSLLVP